MLERVALVAGHLPSVVFVVFAVSLVDARRAPAPVAAAEVAGPAPVEEVPPPTASWPRLTGEGFAGTTARDLASFGALTAAFPGAVVTPRWSTRTFELDAPIREPAVAFAHLIGLSLLPEPHYAAIEVAGGRATKVTVTRPGVVTSHGLQVGEPLAGVLRVPGAQCAVDCYFSDGRQMFVPFVRCRVPAGKGVLRYDASVSELLFADDLSIAPRPPTPRGGRALARWIVDEGLVIDGIMWDAAAR